MATAKTTPQDPLQWLRNALPELSKEAPLMIKRAVGIILFHRNFNRDTLPHTAAEREAMYDRLQHCADYARHLADALTVGPHTHQKRAALHLRNVASTVLPVASAGDDTERQIMHLTANADDGRVDQFAALLNRLCEAIQREADILRPTPGRAVNVASDVLIFHLAVAWSKQMPGSALAEDGRFGKLCAAAGTLVDEDITPKQIVRVLRNHGLKTAPKSTRKG